MTELLVQVRLGLQRPAERRRRCTGRLRQRREHCGWFERRPVGSRCLPSHGAEERKFCNVPAYTLRIHTFKNTKHVERERKKERKRSDRKKEGERASEQVHKGGDTRTCACVCTHTCGSTNLTLCNDTSCPKNKSWRDAQSSPKKHGDKTRVCDPPPRPYLGRFAASGLHHPDLPQSSLQKFLVCRATMDRRLSQGAFVIVASYTPKPC